jgi:hypothetical protein
VFTFELLEAAAADAGDVEAAEEEDELSGDGVDDEDTRPRCPVRLSGGGLICSGRPLPMLLSW